MRLFQTLRAINPIILYFIMIALGILCGLSEINVLTNTGFIISELFIKIFKLVSLPFISLSILVTIASLPADNTIKKLWQKTLLYTFGTTFIAATVSCLLYLVIRPQNITVGSDTKNVLATQSNYQDYLAHLIPSNFFAPFLEYQVISVLFISILIGIAIRYIANDEDKQIVIRFFRGLHGVFLVITKWIIVALPIGIFGFITTTTAQLHSGIHLGGLGAYLAVVVAANLIQGFVVLPLWLKSNNIKPFYTMKQMMPALSVAFFSKSSAGTLPITMDTAEKRLGVDARVSRFILPLCTTLNMNGCAAFIFATVIYLMQNQGIDITLSTMLIWIVIATIAAVGNAGVPMGCFFLSASLLSGMNTPITLLAIILPFYSVIDMIETTLNVWSDSCVAKTVNDKYLQKESQALSGFNQPAIE